MNAQLGGMSSEKGKKAPGAIDLLSVPVLNEKPTLPMPNTATNTSINNISKTFQSYEKQNSSQPLSFLSKIHNEQLKYSGKDDSFDYKFSIFFQNAARVGVMKEDFTAACTFMLKEETLDFYLTNNHSSQK